MSVCVCALVSVTSVFVCVGIRQPKCVSSNRLYVCACVGVCVSVCAYVLSSTVF